jgi:hypothetical protein
MTRVRDIPINVASGARDDLENEKGAEAPRSLEMSSRYGVCT